MTKLDVKRVGATKAAKPRPAKAGKGKGFQPFPGFAELPNFAELPGFAEFPGFGELPGLGDGDFSTFIEANQKIVDDMIAMNREAMEFATKRLKADMDAAQSFTRCKDWSEAMGVQNKYVTAMTEQYFNQAMKIMNMASQLVARNNFLGKS